jgi:branched-chain amino acid transport system ATP-binding protein
MALFEARHLHKRFGDQVVLENITLAFEEGRLSGIMGPNGAGKTTCFNVLTGRFRPDRGQVVFDGEDITGFSPHAIARRGIARSFQLMNLFDDYSALENVLLALPEIRRRGFDCWRPLLGDDDARERALQVLHGVGLAERALEPARRLAYGERRALEIGVALAARPKIVFLDEPTAGLDPHARATTWTLVCDLRNRGVTVVLTTHAMDEAEQLCDAIAIIDRGRLVASGTPAELTAAVDADEIRFSVRPGTRLDRVALGAALGGSADTVVEHRPGEYVVRAAATPARVAALTAWFRDHDVTLAELGTGRRTLEEVFLRLTSDGRQ